MTRAKVFLQTKITARASQLNKYTLLYLLRERCLEEKRDLQIEDYELSYIEKINTLFLQKTGFRRQVKDLTLPVLQQIFSFLEKGDSN